MAMDSTRDFCKADTKPSSELPYSQPDDDEPHLKQPESNDVCGSQRVFKKSSPNSMLTLYLPTRDLVSCNGRVNPLRGVLHVDKDFAKGHRIYGQLTLTFRYGREDEEVMGLRFCNEAVMCLKQIYQPMSDKHENEALTPLQEALIKRLGEGALPFSVEINPQAPPSVQLVPAKRYYGAPIGTSYDVRCYVADRSDEKLHRRSTVRMSVRMLQKTDLNAIAALPPETSATLENNVTTNSSSCDSAPQTPGAAADQNSGSGNSIRPPFNSQMSSSSGGGSLKSKTDRADSFTKLKLSPKAFRFTGKLCRSKSEIEKDSPENSYALSQNQLEQTNGPQGAVDKPFLLQDGRVGLRASLDKSIYGHGEEVTVTVHIRNDSRKTVRRIRVFAIQHVDVCMFNNGKFKNIVAEVDQGDHSVGPGDTHHNTYKLLPKRGQTKNWIALEDSLQRCNDPDQIKSHIASSALRNANYFVDEKNVFAIYVSYYVKVKLTLSGMGGELSLKLPFTLAQFETGDTTDTVPQQESIATDDDPNDNAVASDWTTAAKSIVTTTTEEAKNSPLIVAEVETHQNINSRGNNNQHDNSRGRCLSSSSTLHNTGQVSRDGEEAMVAEEEEDSTPPMSCALRQRRFSQARQERIRPVDDSLDRIETLSDDGDVGLGCTELPGVPANLDTTLGGIQSDSKMERRLTGSSTSLEETEMLDEVFCDTLTIGQQQQKGVGVGVSQGRT